MKKAFTLIELLIVVVVIVTLMSITFKLAGVASNSHARNTTISRLQRIENALSGYYAAFGSYPPVRLHASRNYKLKADPTTGEQLDSEWGGALADNWSSVKVACQAQPFGASFPFDPKVKPYVDACSRLMSQRANSSEEKYKKYRNNPRLKGGFTALDSLNGISGINNKTDWQEIKVFRFGAMSYLMPRYMFMLNGLKNSKSQLNKCAQWLENNELPADPNSGRKFNNWTDAKLWYKSILMRIPSQAVCARWMPNFEKICACSGYPTYFDVQVGSGEGSINPENADLDLYTSSGSSAYVLDTMTVNDGWFHEFYYYSPPPFQSYRVWSAGPDGKTFPTWVPLESIKEESDRRTAANWMSDDIVHMSN